MPDRPLTTAYKLAVGSDGLIYWGSFSFSGTAEVSRGGWSGTAFGVLGDDVEQDLDVAMTALARFVAEKALRI